jgi:glycine/D-amino acid oxidase-like deaminating enzyme
MGQIPSESGEFSPESVPVTLPRTSEVVVVGAGAIGSFAALYLARARHEVTVLERNVPGVEASGTNAGSLGAQNKPVRLGALSVEAIDAWRGFEAETGLDAGYHRTGGFRVAEDKAGGKRLREIAAAQAAVGIPIEHIDGDEARRRAPYLSSAVLAANYCPLDGHNNALIASALVAHAARQAGARVMTGVTVERIDQGSDGSIVVWTDRGVTRCERLILSAGVWSRDFLVAAGIDLPVVLRINQMMVTEQAPPLLEHVVFHVDGHLTLKQVHPAKSCLIGGGWPGGGDYRSGRKETLLASTIGNAAVALRIVPALARLRVLRSWSGFDWRTSDQMPVIGELPGHDGIFVCTSCFGGYTLSPLLGRGLGQAAISGSLPPELEPFSPANTLARLAPDEPVAKGMCEMPASREAHPS